MNRWKHRLLYLWNFYPPFLGAGIRIKKIDPDFQFIETKLVRGWWNTNYVGTLFGGAMYMMADPFHMVLLIERLGSGYLVRDKGAEIQFLKKGMSSVTARFSISDKLLAEIQQNSEPVQEIKIPVSIFDENGEEIARVVKILHIRRKDVPTK